MGRLTLRNANMDLPPLPDDATVLKAVHDIHRRKTLEYENSGVYRDTWVTANEVARALRIVGARRAGRGAVKGSWSGTMSAALRISPRLRALEKRGLLISLLDDDGYRNTYITQEDSDKEFTATMRGAQDGQQ